MIHNRNSPVYILGDVHGENFKLMSLISKFDLENCSIICVGDLGIGFYHPEVENKRNLSYSNFFKQRNIDFYSIRGNHDDPKFFTGATQIVLPCFELLEDYSVITINDERYMFVGGAISIDRIYRKANIDYWENEALIFKPELVKECDVLITHSSPPWNGPFDKLAINAFISNWEKTDPTIWEECVHERANIEKIISLSKATSHYCGHFHMYSCTQNLDCRSTIIDILSLKEHTYSRI